MQFNRMQMFGWLTLDSGRAQMKREGAKGCGGLVWRWREDLSRFTVMEKRVRTHSMSRMTVSDQGDQHEHWQFAV